MKLVTPEDDEDDELQTISSPVSTDTTSKTEVDLNGESLTCVFNSNQLLDVYNLLFPVNNSC